MSALKLGVLTAVLFAVAVVNDWSVPDRLVTTLVTVLVMSWAWSRFSLRRLGLTRSLSLDRVRAGDWISEELTLRNVARLPRLWVEVRDHSSLPGYQAGHVVHLRGKGEATWTTSGRCERRGRYRLGPVSLHSGDPLGLFRSRLVIPATHELVVYPPRINVSDVPLPLASLPGSRTASPSGFSSAHTVSGIREYASGDPMNRIAWSATARAGRMMVKEFDPDPASDLWVLLDLNPPAGGAIADDPALASPDETLEYAIAVAGSLAERALESGSRAGLIVNRAMPIRLDADSSQRQWLRIFETLAVASPFGERSLVEAIQADARRFTRTAGLIVVTASAAADWAHAAHSLVMRQVPVTAVLVGDAEILSAPAMTQLKERLHGAHVQVAEMAPGERLAGRESPWLAVA